MASKLDESGVWDAHLQPVKPTVIAEHSDYTPAPILPTTSSDEKRGDQKLHIHQYLGRKDTNASPPSQLSTFRLFGNKLEDILQEFTDTTTGSPSNTTTTTPTTTNVQVGAHKLMGVKVLPNNESGVMGIGSKAVDIRPITGRMTIKGHQDLLLIPPLPAFPLGLASAFLPAAFDNAVDMALDSFPYNTDDDINAPSPHGDFLLKLLDEIDQDIVPPSIPSSKVSIPSTTTNTTTTIQPKQNQGKERDYLELLEDFVGKNIPNEEKGPILNLSVIENALGKSVVDPPKPLKISPSRKLGDRSSTGELWMGVYQSKHVTMRKYIRSLPSVLYR
jgi:hypothetical protein